MIVAEAQKEIRMALLGGFMVDILCVTTMSYDGQIASRVRRVLAGRREIEEKAMSGGLAFMVPGHMCCGVVQAKLMVRVDPEAYDRRLKRGREAARRSPGSFR